LLHLPAYAWKVRIQRWRASHVSSDRHELSAEYILKGAYESTIGRLSEWTSGHQFTAEDQYAYNVSREYADFVHVQPFYEVHFARDVKGLWAENSVWGPHPIRKWERRLFLTIDYASEALYCWLIEQATYATYGREPEETYAGSKSWTKRCCPRFRI
jgi:hypothetical protein